jgi:hypothetical protein
MPCRRGVPRFSGITFLSKNLEKLSTLQKEALCRRLVEAAGIEPYPALFEKRRRRATFVINSMKGKGFGSNSLSR